MPDRDVLSEARHIENPPSLAEKAATTLLKPVRAGLGFLANVAAKNVMLSEFVPNTDLPPPEMSNPLKKDANGRVLMDGANQPIRDSRQLQVDKMAFQPANGPPQQVEGWVMPAEPGKPTMVFFGGSNFNRNDEDYTNAISMMANDAKARGLGFAVYDYPEGVNEEMARQFVDQMQNHLQDDLGMPLSQQAYCGYSQGSFMASYAAANNPDSAGLQITDGFSSARQYQKEKMDAGAGPLSALIEKRQITEHWDNIPLAQDIAVRRDQQHPDARMPVVAVYTDQHDFGVEGNLHMTPLIENLQGEHGGVVVNLSHEQDHLKMLGTIEHGDGARQLMDQAATHVANANRQLIGNGQTLAAQQGPAVHTPSVREQLASRLAKTGSEQKLREVPDHIKEEYKAEQKQLSAIKSKILDNMDPAKMNGESPAKMEILEKEMVRVQAKLDGMKQENPGLKQMDRNKVGQVIHSAIRDAAKSAGNRLS